MNEKQTIKLNYCFNLMSNYNVNLLMNCRSDKLNSMVLLYQEVDNAMSWLSTLGGAFSALGDNFGHCVSIINYFY